MAVRCLGIRLKDTRSEDHSEVTEEKDDWGDVL